MTALEELTSYGYSPAASYRPGRYLPDLEGARAALFASYLDLVRDTRDVTDILARWIGGLGLRTTAEGTGALAELVTRWDADSAATDTDDVRAVNRRIAAAREIEAGIAYARDVDARTFADAVEATAEDVQRQIGAGAWTLIELVAVGVGIYVAAKVLAAQPGHA